MADASIESAGELDIRPVSPADDARLADLFAACFGTTVARGYFAWKYRENPAGDVVGFVADAGNRLAAFYGVIPEPWSVGGTDATVFQSMDTMTHPDFRRRGLFVALAARTFEQVGRRHGTCDLVGIPGPTSYHGFVDKLRWIEAHEFRPIVLPAFAARRRPGRSAALGVEQVAGPDPRVQRVLLQAPRPVCDAWPRLDGAFFDWRVFGHSPKRLRVALAADPDGTPVAVCVYALTSPRTTLISYISGVAGVDRRRWFSTLLRFVARTGTVLYSWEPQDRALAGLFRRAGFLPQPLRRGPLSLRWPLCVHSDSGSVNGVPWNQSTVFDVQPLMHD